MVLKAEKLRKSFIFLMKILTYTLLCMAFGLIFGVKYPFTGFFSMDMAIVGSSYAILLLCLGNVYGGFKIGRLRETEVMYSLSLACMLCNIFAYFQISLINKRLVSVFPLILLSAIDVLIIVFMTYCGDRLYFKLTKPIKILFVYKGLQEAEIIKAKFDARYKKYRITKMLPETTPFDEIIKSLSDNDAVLVQDIDVILRRRLVQQCFHVDKKVFFTPCLTDILVNRAIHIQVGDMPVMVARHRGPTMEQRIIKRAADVVLSALGIVIASPIMAIVALAIKLYDKGPCLFKQERYTVNSRVFNVYKFRSMIVDAEKDGVARLASQNDDRITPVGKVIRKLRLDELPQLFNILKGDMSFVGPRPERPQIADEYEKHTPDFKYRLRVKAGLTGLAQVMGKYNTTPEDKLKLDLMYIENYSLLLDIKIMFLTFKIMFMSESTEGVGEGQTVAGINTENK